MKLLVILGHTSCGAVKATLDGGEQVSNIGAIAQRISPAAVKAKARNLDAQETAFAASVQNVREQMKACQEQSTVIRERIDSNVLKIVGAIYDIETGRVEFL